MTESTHTFATLRELASQLSFLEQQHREAVAFGEDRARVDREASIAALAAIVDFLQRRGIETGGLHRLLDALFSERPAAMLTPVKKPGRQVDRVSAQAVKGALAGIMQIKQECGMTRQAAARWVAANIPREMAARISSKSGPKAGQIAASSIEEWMARYGGAHGEPGTARDRYLLICQRTKTLKDAGHVETDRRLKSLMTALSVRASI